MSICRNALAALLASVWLNASAVEIHFAGTIHQSNSMSGQLWGLESLIPIGTSFHGSFSYDPDAPLIWSAVQSFGTESRYGGQSFAVSVGAMSFVSATSAVTVIDGTSVPDQFGVWSNVPDYGLTTSGSPFPVWGAGLNLEDSSRTWFANTALPAHGVDGTGFDHVSFSVLFFNDASSPVFDAYFLSGTVTSISVVTPVPEPSTYALMLAGLGAVAFAARRRRVKDAHLTA